MPSSDIFKIHSRLSTVGKSRRRWKDLKELGCEGINWGHVAHDKSPVAGFLIIELHKIRGISLSLVRPSASQERLLSGVSYVLFLAEFVELYFCTVFWG